MSKLKAVAGDLPGVLFALLMVGAMAAALLGVGAVASPPNESILFLIPVIVAATRWGMLPAIAAAVAGSGAAAYFLYPPYFSLQVASQQQIVDLVLFTLVAIVTSRLAATLKLQAEIARKREKDLRDLYAFSRRLAAAHAASDIYGAIRDHLATVTQREVVLFGPQSARPVNAGSREDASLPEPVRAAVARIAAAEPDAATGISVRDDEGGLWLARPVSVKSPDFGIIAVEFGPVSGKDAEDVHVRIDEACSDAAATLERLDVARAIHQARIRSETEHLREALIGSVSHELRTPLASILGAATILGNAPALAQDQRLASLTGLVRDEAERLNNDIQNLLDATRISHQGVSPHREWTEPVDIVNSALARRQQLLARPLNLELAKDLPLLYVDSVLVEQALVQILDNAAKYSPPNAPITLCARRDGDDVIVSVSDEGAGLTAEERQRLGQRFFRGDRTARVTGGSGLGLWIADAFVAANGGRLAVTSEGAGRGSTISIILPLHHAAPALLNAGADE